MNRANDSENENGAEHDINDPVRLSQVPFQD